MHLSSLQHVERLVKKYLADKDQLNIVDIGSYDVNGSYKQFFNKPNWHYTGIDLEPGPNVDVVLTSPYRLPLPSHSADVIVSGQTFEHIQYFWLTWLEMARVLKPGGMIFLLAPSRVRTQASARLLALLPRQLPRIGQLRRHETARSQHRLGAAPRP